MDLRSSKVDVTDEYAAMEYFWEQGWTDGLPIVAPTRERIEACLAHAGIDSQDVIGSYEARASALTAEKLAINAVMAGCKPEYMPVLVAAFEGLTDPAFRMNHMASLGSPWPLVIVNGPIVERLGMNTGQYLLGPTGNRANATIGRAVSLTMANCFDAKVGGVQRGTMGNPNRWSFCAAEREDSPWPRVHEQRGLAGGVSAVTVVGTMDGVLQFVTPNFTDPTDLCELIAQRIAYGFFTLGTFVVMMAPVFQQHFIDAGWTQDDVKTYLTEHTRRSVASLKIDGRWERYGTRLSPTAPPIEPGDDTRLIPMRHDPALIDILYTQAEYDRTLDFLIMACGGEAGNYGAYVGPYPQGTEPVTVPIKD